MTEHAHQTQSEPKLQIACLSGALLAVVGLVLIMWAPPVPHLFGKHSSMLSVHLLLELFAIVIAALIVTVSWHTFDVNLTRSANVLVVGFTVVGVCDLVHALTYAGMPPLLGSSSTPRAIFFWLMGRSAEALTLGLVALGWVPRLSRNASLLGGVGLSVAVVLWGSYFLEYFPVTFVPGEGVTAFKANYEYVLCALNLSVAVLLYRRMRRGGGVQEGLLALSCWVIGVGELAFTAYVTPSDFQNIFGHTYKLIAYALLYRATFLASLRAPFDALRESEQRVRESEQRLRSLSNNLPSCAVYQLVREPDGQMRFLHISESIGRLTGISAAEALRDASCWYGLLEPQDAACLKQSEASSAQSLATFDMVLRLRRRDGQMRWMHVYAAPRRLADGRTVWDGVQMDVTEHKQDEDARRSLEMQLRESQKMQALGTLAGGIAHDFNNVLGAILGNLALAQQELDQRELGLVRQSLVQVRTASLRARALVQQILSFSRRQTPHLERQALRPIVEEALALLRATLPAGVVLELALSDEDLQVNADPTQLEQVLMNLCTNAWQSLRDRAGHVGVGYARVHLQASDAVVLDGLPAGDYVRLWVRDDGQGMDELTVQRIFEPFFTTKPSGQGTGLGLSVVHGIVRAHHGALRVESRLGQGSTFEVYLPLAAHALHSAAPVPALAVDAGASGQGRRVLYIDDDELMVLMVERLLERQGFAVTCLRDPQRAVAAVRLRAQDFDVVVTDYNMPDLSGLEVVQQLAQIRPDLPVLISSGYVSPELQAEARRQGVRALLQKENTLEDLVPLLLQVLGLSPASAVAAESGAVGKVGVGA